MNKWVGISLGAIVGLSHIGMIGMIARNKEFPVVNLPVGPYTSYSVEASKEGYKINYRANDPKVMHVERDIKRKGGFLGLGNNTTKVREQYTMDGVKHLEGRESGNGLSKSEIACIKAEGGGEQTGRLVGGSVAGLAAPTLSGIPIVGWVLAGAATMIGMDTGADIGGTMARDLSNCDAEIDEKINN